MSILFCTPCYGGMIHEAHFRSCLNLKESLLQGGVEHDWLTGRNESLITRARMEMCASFLKTGHTHLCWIDADIDFEPGHIAALWNLQADVAVGLYHMKNPKVPLAAWRNGKLVDLAECPKEPFEVDYAGTGLFMVSRETINKVVDLLKNRSERVKLIIAQVRALFPEADDQQLLDRWVDLTAASYQGPNGEVPALYMSQIHNGILESEDYNFCRIAREAGCKIIADASIELGHWGQHRYCKPSEDCREARPAALSVCA